MKAITLANSHKDHIPPITTTESNPFPYQICIGAHPHQKDQQNAYSGWATRMGIY